MGCHRHDPEPRLAVRSGGDAVRGAAPGAPGTAAGVDYAAAPIGFGRRPRERIDPAGRGARARPAGYDRWPRRHRQIVARPGAGLARDRQFPGRGALDRSVAGEGTGGCGERRRQGPARGLARRRLADRRDRGSARPAAEDAADLRWLRICRRRGRQFHRGALEPGAVAVGRGDEPGDIARPG